MYKYIYQKFLIYVTIAIHRRLRMETAILLIGTYIFRCLT